MPIYTFSCDCGRRHEERRQVDDRNVPAACECGGVALRHFEPSQMIVIPNHFQFPRGWHLPPKEDHAAWEHLEKSSSARTVPPKVETLREYVDKLPRDEVRL